MLQLDIQPDHHLIRIPMLYKKNGLLNTLLKLFARFRGAKRHVRQNSIFYVFFSHFYSFANFSYLVSLCLHFVCALFALFALHNNQKNNSDDYIGLQIEDMHLHGALTWRHFRFIVIGGF